MQKPKDRLFYLGIALFTQFCRHPECFFRFLSNLQTRGNIFYYDSEIVVQMFEYLYAVKES